MVLRQGGVLVLAGMGLGVVAAIPLVRFVASMLFEVQPLDAAVFAMVAAMVTGVAMAATLIPARRASRIEPISALRAE
jgi:ABC-type antimicrobial peptide transport system permease subunit